MIEDGRQIRKLLAGVQGVTAYVFLRSVFLEPA